MSGVTDRGKPLYMIGVVADMLNVHPQTLRFYEKKGLVRPSRTVGRTRMYSTASSYSRRRSFLSQSASRTIRHTTRGRK